MRGIAVIVLVAACGGHSNNAAVLRPPERPVAKVDPVAGPPPLVDDAMLVSGRTHEHLVIHGDAGGRIYDVEVTHEGSSEEMVFHFETDASGALAAATMDLADHHYEARRDGDELVLAGANGEERAPYAELYAPPGVVGQLAELCITPGARTLRNLSGAAVTAGPPVTAAGSVWRVRAHLVDGVADLYCDGASVLALDGPGNGVTVREGSEDAFAAARLAPPDPPALPADATEEERTVSVKAADAVTAATLACSYVAPATPPKHMPAVLLGGGGEADDRDGDFGKDPYRRRYVLRALAYRLAEAGIASLRCDPRGAGTDHSRTVEEIVADAAAALKALRGEAHVDRARVGYLGNNDAAGVAPLVWKAAAVRALVMLQPRARRMEDYWLAIGEHQARARGADQTQIDHMLDMEREIFAAIIAGDPIPADVPEQIAAVHNSMYDYERSFLAYDPSAAAAKIQKAAVLLVDPQFGDAANDANDGYDDVAALEQVLEQATGKKKNVVETKTYPLVDGVFRTREQDDPSMIASWWTPVSDELLGDIVDFLSRQLR